MLVDKIQSVKDFGNLHGYRVYLSQTSGLKFKCVECDLFLPIAIAVPVANPATAKQTFFTAHVAHAQTCALLPDTP